LVLDLRIAHDRVGSSDDPTLNGHLKYPNNLDQSLNDTVRVGGYIVNLLDFYSCRLIGKLTDFWQLQEFSLRKQTPVVSPTSVARLLLL
jgi:hypothetical protein